MHFFNVICGTWRNSTFIFNTASGPDTISKCKELLTHCDVINTWVSCKLLWHHNGPMSYSVSLGAFFFNHNAIEANELSDAKFLSFIIERICEAIDNGFDQIAVVRKYVRKMRIIHGLGTEVIMGVICEEPELCQWICLSWNRVTYYSTVRDWKMYTLFGLASLFTILFIVGPPCFNMGLHKLLLLLLLLFSYYHYYCYHYFLYYDCKKYLLSPLKLRRSFHNTYPNFLALFIRCTDYFCDSCHLTDINPYFITSPLPVIWKSKQLLTYCDITKTRAGH